MLAERFGIAGRGTEGMSNGTSFDATTSEQHSPPQQAESANAAQATTAADTTESSFRFINDTVELGCFRFSEYKNNGIARIGIGFFITNDVIFVKNQSQGTV